MRSVLLCLALLGVLPCAAGGQDRPQRPDGPESRPGEGPVGPGRRLPVRPMTRAHRERLEALRRSFMELGPEARQFRLRALGKVVDSMTPGELRRLAEMPIEEARREVERRALEIHRREEARFIAGLPEETRTDLAAIEGPARQRRLVELRFEALRENTLRQARERGVLDEEGVASVIALGREEQLRALRDVQKRIFLAIHAEDIDRMRKHAPELVRRLESLDPAGFFDDPKVQEFITVSFFSREQIESMRSWRRERLVNFLEGLRRSDGQGDPDGFLTEAQRDRLLRMDPAERNQLVNRVARAKFARAVGPPDRAPRDARRPPPGVEPGDWGRVAPEERERFLRMTPEERATFLRDRR